MKDKKVTGRSWYMFPKGDTTDKSDTFCFEITGLVNVKIPVNADYLYFCEVFDTISHNILTETQMKYCLGKWTVRCSKIWLD